MRIIKTTKAYNDKSVALAYEDVDRISKEMVNIYHGIQYYDSKGILLDKPVPDYMKFDYETMSYEFIPTRGYIYIKKHNNAEYSCYDLLIANLHTLFEHNNKWGYRDSVYLSQNTESTNFIIGQSNVEDYSMGNIGIFVGKNAYSTKHSEFQFSWIIVDSDKSIFQYKAPGKYISPHQLVSSMATIVVDTTHSLNFEDGYRCLDLPELDRPIHILPRAIILSPLVGVDGHIYQLLGGEHTSKRFGRFRPINRQIREAPSVMPTKYYRKLKTIEDLGSQTACSTDGTTCGVCNVEVFDSYYLVEKSDKHCALCKFCAHFDPKIAATLTDLQYKVMRCTSSTTADQLVEACDMPDLERMVLRSFLQVARRGDISCKLIKEINKSVPRLAMSTPVVTWGTCLGIPSGFYDRFETHCLDIIHTFADNTYIFKYSRAWY